VNIVDVIRRETGAMRDKTAVVEGGRQLTYGELLSAAERFGEVLRTAGIRPADRVAFVCGDSADYIIGSLAILRLSAVMVPVSPSLMLDETEQVFERMDVNWIVSDARARRGGEERLAGLAAGLTDFRLARRAAGPPPDGYGATNPAFIRFSSGTTGASKGILLSHESIVARTDAADAALRVTSADVIPWVLSMSFHYVVTILLFLRRGAAIVLCGEPPFPEAFARAVRDRRGTLLYASPFHYHVLAHAPFVAPADLAGVRLAVSTAMSLPAETAAAFARKFGAELAEAYGIIEVGLPFANAPARRDKRGSVGRALPAYACRIADPGPDGVGEILVRGPGLFDAYVSPWRPREAALSDGWFRTGDLGRRDADGFLFIVGREKNVINFAGMKIFPAEVEAAIGRHPAVAECMVYGVAHPQYGQVPRARVVLKDGASFDEAELRRCCYRHLAAHKVPKVIERTAALERTASGKIRRTP